MEKIQDAFYICFSWWSTNSVRAGAVSIVFIFPSLALGTVPDAQQISVEYMTELVNFSRPRYMKSSPSSPMLGRNPGKQLEGERWCLTNRDLKLTYKTWCSTLASSFSFPSITGPPFNNILTLGFSWVRMREHGSKEDFLWEARELWEWDLRPTAPSEWGSCLPRVLLVQWVTATTWNTLFCFPLSIVIDSIC